MTAPAIVAILAATFTFASHGAHVARADELARLCLFAAAVLVGALVIHAAAVVAL